MTFCWRVRIPAVARRPRRYSELGEPYRSKELAKGMISIVADMNNEKRNMTGTKIRDIIQ